MGGKENGDSGQQVEETSGDEQSEEKDEETPLAEALAPSDDPEDGAPVRVASSPQKPGRRSLSAAT